MKIAQAARVPLAAQVLVILKELDWARSVSLTPIGRALYVREYPKRSFASYGFQNEDMTSHGFRVSASSMLNESGLWNADAIERQLAHVDGDSVRRAYARAEFWDERSR